MFASPCHLLLSTISGDKYIDFDPLSYKKEYSLIKTSRGGFQIGWVSQGFKVKSLEKKGRVLTAPDQPLPKDEIKFLDREANKYIKKGLGKSKTTRHKIGRK